MTTLDYPTVAPTQPDFPRQDHLAESLRGLCGGGVYLPGDPGYDQKRVPWNLAVDQRPAAIAVPRDVSDVSTVVRAARAVGLRVAPQTTGHNPGPLVAQSLHDVVLMHLGAMTEVSYDAETQTMRVGGGALWQAAVECAADAGRAVLHGSSPDVGVVGYSLGGGIGWYARKLGLATNSVTAAEVVIGDGTLMRADATHHSELFWALRGGGGNFGIVTALEFATFPIETAYAGLLLWDGIHAERVLRRWGAWTTTAPDEVTTSFRIMNLPPLPELPEFLRGRRVVIIDGAVLDDDARAAAILADLRALGPELDTFARVPARSLSRLHMDPEGHAPAVSDALLLREFPEQAIPHLLAAGPGHNSTLTFVELRQLGGALARPAASAGALPLLDGQFVAFACAMAPTPEIAERGLVDASNATATLACHAAEHVYLNFAERRTDTRRAYAADIWPQLKGIRAAVDEHGTFVANHSIPRPYENGRATD